MSQESIQQTFEVTSPANLYLSNICGSVEIRPGQDDLIQVTAVKHSGNCDAEHTQIQIEQGDDGAVSVKTHFDAANLLVKFRAPQPCCVDYIVEVPTKADVLIKGVSCSILVKGLAGKTNVKTVSGDLQLVDLNGPFVLDSVSGDISGENLSGGMKVNLVSGDLHLKNAQIPSLHATTVSGDLAIETPLGEGPYKINSVSGDTELVVPADTSCKLSINSLSGDLLTDLPVDSASRSHGHQWASIQGGGVEVAYHSVSGDLCIHHSENVRPVRAASGQPIAPAVDRRAILDKLDQGEMTVEEALTQLRA
ncbi:MAG: DUF4097 family beta strand repeat-containing protein [Chloroflexota bacterium]